MDKPNPLRQLQCGCSRPRGANLLRWQERRREHDSERQMPFSSVLWPPIPTEPVFGTGIREHHPENTVSFPTAQKFGVHADPAQLGGPSGQGQELHRFAGDLVMRALFDDEAARRHVLSDKLAEATHWAIRVPRDISKQLKRMAVQIKDLNLTLPDGLPAKAR